MFTLRRVTWFLSPQSSKAEMHSVHRVALGALQMRKVKCLSTCSLRGRGKCYGHVSPHVPLAIARLSLLLNYCPLFPACFSVFKLRHCWYLGLAPGCFSNKVIFSLLILPSPCPCHQHCNSSQRGVVALLWGLFHGVMKNGNEYSFWTEPGDILEVYIALENATSLLLQEISLFLAFVFFCQHIGSG